MFSFAAWKYVLKFCLAALNCIALIWRKIETLQTEKKNLCISDADGCFVSKCDVYSCYFQVVSIATKVFFGFLLQLHKSCKECRPFLRTYRTHANISEVIFQCHFCCHNPNYVYIKTRVMPRPPSWFCQIWLRPYITCLSTYRESDLAESGSSPRWQTWHYSILYKHSPNLKLTTIYWWSIHICENLLQETHKKIHERYQCHQNSSSQKPTTTTTDHKV